MEHVTTRVVIEDRIKNSKDFEEVKKLYSDLMDMYPDIVDEWLVGDYSLKAKS